MIRNKTQIRKCAYNDEDTFKKEFKTHSNIIQKKANDFANS